MNFEQDNYEIIFREVMEFDPEVRAQFLKYFEHEVVEFCHIMARALSKWRTLDSRVSGRKEIAGISGLAFCTINLAINSQFPVACHGDRDFSASQVHP